jgi:hypothetical protein
MHVGEASAYQDAEKRILNGGCQMADGKTPVFSHLPLAI